VVNLKILSMCDRKQDIPLLAAHFLDRMRRQNGVAYTLSDEALRTMIEYSWPG
jgi:two-component system response regulator HydG